MLPLHKPAIVRSPLTISQAQYYYMQKYEKVKNYFYFFWVSSFFIFPGFFSPVSARSTGCAFCGIGRMTALRFLRNRVSACAALSAEPGERLCCAFCGTGRVTALCFLRDRASGGDVPSAELVGRMRYAFCGIGQEPARQRRRAQRRTAALL